jgi:hypothetical protein
MPCRPRSESGQVIPLFVLLLLAVLLGIAVLVLDVGAWLGASRRAQSVADAAALAAAQDLPWSPAQATTDAAAYAATNGGSLDGATVQPSDTVTVAATVSAPIFFAGIFGITSVTARGHATAQVNGVACVPGQPGSGPTKEPIPLVVSSASAPPAVPFGQQTTLGYGPSYPVGAGQFGLIDFSNSGNGVSPGTIGSWITNGYPGTICAGTLPGISGNKTVPPGVSGPMQALAQSTPTILLPVYSDGASGGNGSYTIVGWAAFDLTSWSAGGSVTTMTGSFRRLIVPVTGGTASYFGVGTLQLTR